MLTEEAYRERMWGRFPALRKALEDKLIPHSYYGLTSVSDNLGEVLCRLVKITILAREHDSLVGETAESVGLNEMYRDLYRLRDELEAASSFFKQQAQDVTAVCSKL